jgi:TonB family protein
MKLLSIDRQLLVMLAKKDKNSQHSGAILAMGLGGSIVTHLGLLAGISYWWQPVAMDDFTEITLVESADIAEAAPTDKIKPPVPIVKPEQSIPPISIPSPKIVAVQPQPIAKILPSPPITPPDVIVQPPSTAPQNDRIIDQPPSTIKISPTQTIPSPELLSSPPLEKLVKQRQLNTLVSESPSAEPIGEKTLKNPEKQRSPAAIIPETLSAPSSPLPIPLPPRKTWGVASSDPSQTATNAVLPATTTLDEPHQIAPGMVEAFPWEHRVLKPQVSPNSSANDHKSSPDHSVITMNKSPASLSKPNSTDRHQLHRESSLISASPNIPKNVASSGVASNQIITSTPSPSSSGKPGLQCIKNCELSKLQDLQDSDGGKDRLRIRIVVDANGLVLESAIAKSSGNPQIDTAVLEGIRQMQFAPPGKTIRGTVKANIFL